MAGYDTVRQALEDADLIDGNGYGDTLAARCPAHEDTRASLSLKEGDDGKALLFCHAGCDVRDVVSALDLEMVDLFSGGDEGAVVATYDYQDEDGTRLYRVVRRSPKGFFQQRFENGGWVSGLGETKRVLYQLPELVAVGPDTPVYVCEGEKDVDALRHLGLVATTLVGGAGKWRKEYAPYFAERDVIVVGDNDDPGRDHVEMLRGVRSGVARSFTALFPAVGKDVSDHLNAGLDLGDLVMENDGLDEFGPMDWDTWEDEKIEWVLEPYIPKGGRTLAFGAAGSLKSLWAMWVAARVAHDGGKVAYFALEMLPGDIAGRMRQLNPPKGNFLMFTRDLRLGSPSHTEKLIAGLKGFDLIVIDSWSSARAHAGRESNEAVAELDNDVMLPIIKTTGAALLILDNTGHAAITNDGKLEADHARGASAKGDKMEVALWFHRPYEDNNYRTTVTVKKMRLNYPAPPSMTIETPRERIEFYKVLDGVRTESSMWDESGDASAIVDSTQETVPLAAKEDMTPEERRKLARLKDMFKATEIEVTPDALGDTAALEGEVAPD